MPVKYAFCRQRYPRSGVNERDLRSAYANRNIILASTIWHPLAPAAVLNDQGTGLFEANEQFEHPDSDKGSDPVGDTPTSELDAPTDIRTGAPAADVLDDNRYPVTPEEEDYLVVREAIKDFKEHNEECPHLGENPWAALACAQGFKLASWFIERIVSRTGIKDYFANGIGNSTSVGSSSMNTLENLL